MFDDVLEYWFGEPAIDTEGYGKKIRRWFMGGPAMDAEIVERFGARVEQALAGELEGWASTIRGRLALILLLDQFTRSIYRDDPRAFSGDAKAQALAVDAFDRGLHRELTMEERQFLAMPLTHAENLALQERNVALTEELYAEAPTWQQQVMTMGLEQSRKYRDVIARFGRFPHRNKVLGRVNTPDEENFLVDWAQKMRPSGADKLPS